LDALALGREQLASMGEVRRDLPSGEIARVMQHAIFASSIIWSLTVHKTSTFVWRSQPQ
jgi:hypothetical protein